MKKYAVVVFINRIKKVSLDIVEGKPQSRRLRML